jgi:hypothetical protein
MQPLQLRTINDVTSVLALYESGQPRACILDRVSNYAISLRTLGDGELGKSTPGLS